jgi:CelD/BcsL family acetyltransferase involved in cellulose biosynthesis
LAADWRNLEKRADGGFFLSWIWIGCWLATIDSKVYVLEGHAGGVLVALGLLCPKERRGLRWPGNNAVYLNQTGILDADAIAIEYNGLLLDRTIALDGAMQGFQALVRDDGPSWDELYMFGLSENFAGAISNGGFITRPLARSPTARVDLVALRQSGQSYLDHRSPNTRAQIRRAIRRYEERGPLCLVGAQSAEQGLEFFDEMAKLHQQYWVERGAPGAFSSRFFRTFHRRLVESAVPEGHVELLHLSAGGSTIGYLYNFIYRKTAYYYASGFSYEDDNQLKPGLVAHTKCVERYLADGMDVYDFMAGAARYKTSLGELGPDMFSYVLEKPTVKHYTMRHLRWIRNLFKG